MFARVFRILAASFLLAAPVAHAQFAVIDVGAIAQLLAQAQTLDNQLVTAQQHLAQAQAEYAAMTGGRGMERLLAGTQRNYLPTDWTTLQSAMQGAGSYSTLSGDIASTLATNSILSVGLMASLPADVRQLIDTSRRLTALHQSVVREALANTSDRFGALQQLIGALPAAADQKAALDLQARIGAENAMLQNEQTKLQTLSQLVQAEQLANEQQLQERALAGHGQFASRFQPVP